MARIESNESSVARGKSNRTVPFGTKILGAASSSFAFHIATVANNCEGTIGSRSVNVVGAGRHGGAARIDVAHRLLPVLHALLHSMTAIDHRMTSRPVV